MCKENKNKTLFNNSSPPSHPIAPFWKVSLHMRMFWSECKWHLNDTTCQRMWCCWHRIAYVVYVCDTLQNGTIGWQGEGELLKSSYFCLLCTQKYSRSFIKFRLNHWCHMDWFANVFGTFLGLERGWTILLRYQQSKEMFIHNMLFRYCSM